MLTNNIVEHNCNASKQLLQQLRLYRLATYTDGVTIDTCLILGMPTKFQPSSSSVVAKLCSDEVPGSAPPMIDILKSTVSLLSTLLFFRFFSFTTNDFCQPEYEILGYEWEAEQEERRLVNSRLKRCLVRERVVMIPSGDSGVWNLPVVINLRRHRSQVGGGKWFFCIPVSVAASYCIL